MNEAYCHNCKKNVVPVWDARVLKVKAEVVLVDIAGRCPICMDRIRHIQEWLDG